MNLLYRDDEDDEDDEDVKKSSMKTFSDENASWLKVKETKELFSDDESDDMSEGDDDDSEEETAIERRARIQDAKIRKLQESAAAELKTNIEEGESLDLEGEEDIQDLQDVQRRIQEIIGVLNNFADSRDPNISRKDYLEKVSD